jgi:outer membrane protein TolC
VNNPKLPRFFTQYTGAPSIGGDLSTVPGIKKGDAVAAKNFFQLKASGTASVTVSENLNASYFVGLQAARTYKELAIRTTSQTKEQVIQQVTKAYYNVLISRERLALFTNNIGRVDSLLRSTRALNENGLAEGIDVDRIQVNLNNLIAERDKFSNLNDLSVELLKYQMNYPTDLEINVIGDIQDIEVTTNLDSYNADWDIRSRPDYQVLETNKKLQALNIKNQFAAGLPSLNVFGTYGYLTQSPNVSGVFKTNSKVVDNGSIGPDKWYNYSQVGASLTIPIFSGLQRHYKIQQERLSMLKIENNFIRLKSTADLEVKQSTTNYKNALKSLTSQKANQELAGKVARITKIKYEQGVGSNLEVVDAENSLRQAQTNYYSALFDAMVAKVDLDKAYGKLLPQTVTDNK